MLALPHEYAMDRAIGSCPERFFCSANLLIDPNEHRCDLSHVTAIQLELRLFICSHRPKQSIYVRLFWLLSKILSGSFVGQERNKTFTLRFRI